MNTTRPDFIYSTILALLVLFAACPMAHAVDSSTNEILITIHSEDISEPAPLYGKPTGYRRQRRAEYSLRLEDEALIDKIAKRYQLKRSKGWPIVPLEVYCEVLTVPAGIDLDVLLKTMGSDADIESVQLLNEFSVQSEVQLYNDPYVSLQYNLADLNVLASHAVTQGSGVKIAIIDSKIDSEHSELRHSIDSHRDFTEDSSKATAEKHGTAVAGLIAAAGNNELGIVGVAPGASLLGLSACRYQRDKTSATCNTFTLAQALSHAIEKKVNIINMSLAGPHDPLLERLIKKASDEDIVIVAAAGDGNSRAVFPANMQEVIAVQTVGRPDTRAVIYAPGKDLLTTTPGNGFEFVTGSSFAAAQITGLLALMFQADPSIKPIEAKNILLSASNDGQLDACSILNTVQPYTQCKGNIKL